jgi:DNA recombination protein RmuC
MEFALLIVIAVLALAALVMLAVLLTRRPPAPDWTEPLARLQSLADLQARAERVAADQFAAARREQGEGAAALRQEVGAALRALGEASAASSKQLREEITVSTQQFNESASASIVRLGQQTGERLAAFGTQLKGLSDSLDQRFAELRRSVEERLVQLQADNSARLEQMRATVDEKLQGTLEKRLGESFKQVSDRLEQVHKGLGEMQALSSGVTDLRRVMTNVKARGTWGEWQLGALLEQILQPDQFAKNVKTKERGGEAVEFAVKLPGPDDAGHVWLPIDSKFPIEDYERLLAASEAADAQGVAEAGKALEARVKSCARDIREKYLSPPLTTDWGILFVPTESLYAEVLRRPGLMETMQREMRVTICGPTTLAAVINSLQMGFRTLAIQKHAGEVFKLLGVVKTQFESFAGTLAAVQKKLDEASDKVGEAARRTEQIGKKLRHVEALPTTGQAPALPPASAPGPGVIVREQADDPLLRD